MNKCTYCSNETPFSVGYISMVLPIPEIEDLIDKWKRENWWENLERKDLTPEEQNELTKISYYDQMLNTVSRGVICEECSIKENQLYNKYYPEVK
jgi:hypothetical protein